MMILGDLRNANSRDFRKLVEIKWLQHHFIKSHKRKGQKEVLCNKNRRIFSTNLTRGNPQRNVGHWQT